MRENRCDDMAFLALQVFRPCLACDCLRQMNVHVKGIQKIITRDFLGNPDIQV